MNFHKLTYNQAIPFPGYELPDCKLTYNQAICILRCILLGDAYCLLHQGTPLGFASMDNPCQVTHTPCPETLPSIVLTNDIVKIYTVLTT